MNNLHLFDLINAPPGLSGTPLAAWQLLALWAASLVPVALAAAWFRGDRGERREVLQIGLAIALALVASRGVRFVWPQAGPSALHLGVQYLAPADDPGLPCDQATLAWTAALAAMTSRRFALWTFPLLTLGLVVGWSRIYLGVNFPYDVVAAVPMALVGAGAAAALRSSMQPFFERVLSHYDRCDRAVRTWLHRSHGT